LTWPCVTFASHSAVFKGYSGSSSDKWYTITWKMNTRRFVFPKSSLQQLIYDLWWISYY
jgi:hypothetical protein